MVHINDSHSYSSTSEHTIHCSQPSHQETADALAHEQPDPEREPEAPRRGQFSLADAPLVRLPSLQGRAAMGERVCEDSGQGLGARSGLLQGGRNLADLTLEPLNLGVERCAR